MAKTTTDILKAPVTLNEFDENYQQGEQDIRNSKARKRIDELLEKKRLKELLDDSEDWDI